MLTIRVLLRSPPWIWNKTIQTANNKKILCEKPSECRVVNGVERIWHKDCGRTRSVLLVIQPNWKSGIHIGWFDFDSFNINIVYCCSTNGFSLGNHEWISGGKIKLDVNPREPKPIVICAVSYELEDYFNSEFGFRNPRYWKSKQAPCQRQHQQETVSFSSSHSFY